MERLRELTPHLNPLLSEGRGEEFADECRRALNLLSLKQRERRVRD